MLTSLRKTDGVELTEYYEIAVDSRLYIECGLEAEYKRNDTEVPRSIDDREIESCSKPRLCREKQTDFLAVLVVAAPSPISFNTVEDPNSIKKLLAGLKVIFNNRAPRPPPPLLPLPGARYDSDLIRYGELRFTGKTLKLRQVARGGGPAGLAPVKALHGDSSVSSS
ncbi:hypothetical protein EVAR_45518_1 [Eumeta japonica]|uniref:Uncharacterized protein n=1 Tax=Eumeta variegata TaxID=151549 RepID=A0A4C1X6C4_EUMVA|nr:hypothetical protein EVAR_45518_1 [Eumeta japonica]